MPEINVLERANRNLAHEMKSFISDRSRGGDEIADMIGHLSQVGDVAIFGGMPRDIARGGHDGFCSDVDLVVDACPRALASLFRDAEAKRNRFGGYRLHGRRHVFDVWALRETWAIKHGHIPVEGLPDLVRTTSFNCDAVVYLCSTRTIRADAAYVAWLHGRGVDINLEANPNPHGAAARAEKIVKEWGESITPRLAAYVQAWTNSRFSSSTTCRVEPWKPAV